MSVLDEIIAGVAEDLALRRSETPMNELLEQAHEMAPVNDPLPAMRARELSVIAEVKRRSPSKGALAQIPDPAALARSYQAGGCAAISVLTEERRFEGSLADLDQVRAAVSSPLLRKDFLFTPYQVIEARAHGADLILLIVAALEPSLLKELYQLAAELGMRALVEIHDPDELETALELQPELLGINARNLRTLEVDPSAFERLCAEIPSGPLRVAESGIGGVADAQRYANLGADVVLVGEALVKDGDPEAVVRAMSSLVKESR